jgi:hypothetical protein
MDTVRLEYIRANERTSKWETIHIANVCPSFIPRQGDWIHLEKSNRMTHHTKVTDVTWHYTSHPQLPDHVDIVDYIEVKVL